MAKPRRTIRFRGIARFAVSLCALAVALPGCDPHSTSKPALDFVSRAQAAPVERQGSLGVVRAGTETCEAGLADAAQRNREGLSEATFATFGRVETGWEYYEPLIAHEIGTRCGAPTPAFASSLAAWQFHRGLGQTGVMDEATFAAMKAEWEKRRPFVAANMHGCPSSPPEASLAVVPADESYGGKTMLLRPAALAAYARMLAAARAEAPGVKSDPRLLTLFSAYRSAESDAARCALDDNCQGVVRTTCSAHLTGLAIDLYLGAAPGYPPDSSDDANRLHISRSAAYRWMVGNAWRFGFVPYAYEPWHWEWTGEPI
jgi:LAS superfamily LD-carboxypeptidase LdcB